MEFKKILKAPLFSPFGFIVRAVEILAVYFIFTVFGAGRQMSILLGTSFTGKHGISSVLLKAIAATYGLLQLAVYTFVPALIIGAGILFLFNKWTKNKEKS